MNNEVPLMRFRDYLPILSVVAVDALATRRHPELGQSEEEG